ncbi:RsbR, positive regulator of sigma-B [Minicystis rosea]|nr:RsbR, positive regulator of sigma-B [Minicystis rosea]
MKTTEQLEAELAAARAKIETLEGELAEVRSTDAEVRFRRSENLVDVILKTTPDWIFIKDREFRWTLANDAVAKAMDRRAEDLVGKNDLEIGWPAELVFGNPEKGIRGFRTDDMAVLAGEVLHNPHDPATYADGTLHIMDTWKMPLRDDKGEVYGVLAFAHDVTERKRSEEERERLQQEIIAAQQRALQELSTPIIPVIEASDGGGSIIIMPLVGTINTARAQDIMRSLLAGIRQYRAKVVILDVTGVPIVDTSVATHLNKTVLAARLKGAHTIVTGISDAVAETIVELGIDWSGVETLNNLQTGLNVALRNLGLRIVAAETR